jgi:hypothetical protein
MPNTVYCTGSYIAYVLHAVPPTEGRLKKTKLMDLTPCPSPGSLKRGKSIHLIYREKKE